MKYLCPVCGYDQLDEPPEDQTYEICPSCGTEFGYSDFAPTLSGVHKRHLELRAVWLANGAKWWDEDELRPSHWDGRRQLNDYLNPQPAQSLRVEFHV